MNKMDSSYPKQGAVEDHSIHSEVPLPMPRPTSADEQPGKYTNEPYKPGLYGINPFRSDQY
jgi:hypothetical protein